MVSYRIGDYGVDAYTDGSTIIMEKMALPVVNVFTHSWVWNIN